MLLSSSAIMRNSGASRSSSHGVAIARWSAPLLMKRGSLASVRPCPALRAEHLCPNGVFLPPDFPRYRAASLQVREIFARHTHLIEPSSLDEAYLDVTENKTCSVEASDDPAVDSRGAVNVTNSANIQIYS
jgi:nucleotidyltransferase/DNA polymerase involved in DNA repair